ncbi:hypothetical protein F1880_004075 [Penicillium rolfsii]|nr:hypothetical protein F1880_004075 [Penicillium rolfsii]
MRWRQFVIGAKLNPSPVIQCHVENEQPHYGPFSSFLTKPPAILSSMFLLSQNSASQHPTLGADSIQIPTPVSTALINHSQIELPTRVWVRPEPRVTTLKLLSYFPPPPLSARQPIGVSIARIRYWSLSLGALSMQSLPSTTLKVSGKSICAADQSGPAPGGIAVTLG